MSVETTIFNEVFVAVEELVKLPRATSEITLKSFDTHVDNKRGGGIAIGENSKLWVVDRATHKAFQYNIIEEPIVLDTSFDLHVDNTDPTGAVEVNTRLYVLDGTVKEIFVYNIKNATYVRRFAIPTSIQQPTGLTYSPETYYSKKRLWIVSEADNYIFAVGLLGEFYPNENIRLDSTMNPFPQGISYAHRGLYVLDAHRDHTTYYDMTGKISADITFAHDSSNLAGRGIAINGYDFWCLNVSSGNEKILKYNFKNPTLRSVAKELPDLNKLRKSPSNQFPKALVSFGQNEMPSEHQTIGNQYRFHLPFIIVVCGEENTAGALELIESATKLIRTTIEATKRWTASHYMLQLPIPAIRRHQTQEAPSTTHGRHIALRSIEFQILYWY